LAIVQNSADIAFRYKGFSDLKKWILLIVGLEERIPGQITIVYCSDQYLKSVNLQYLNRNYYTDVITFDYNNGNIISGDIMISIDRVQENAEKFNTCFKDELDRVILHGVLHLAGYKDSNSQEVKEMRSKEDYYLELRSSVS
jgi:probable rRNA maturation factor